MKEDAGEFAHCRLVDGIELHLNQTDKFKTIRTDVYLHERLRERVNTRIALIGRLLERGTTSHPDLQSLNRFIDDMYGGEFSVGVEQFGDQQVIHFYLELIDPRFLPKSDPHFLQRGLGFLKEIIREPLRQGDGFSRDYLHQEKKGLRLNIEALYNDKMIFAQRRCIEEMCRGEAYGHSAMGNPDDFRGINAVNLHKFYFDLLTHNPLNIFISGSLDERLAAELFGFLGDLERRTRPQMRSRKTHAPAREQPKKIFEYQEVNQGRLVIGFRTGTTFADRNYPALLLFNMLFGGDHSSILFKHIREERGLCYYIASHLEPLCGLLYITAVIESRDYEVALDGIEEQLDAIRGGKIDENELENAKILLVNRLRMLDDDREGLIRYHYRQKIAAHFWSRVELGEWIGRVSIQDVRKVCAKMYMDTVYFLHGNEETVRWCA